MLKKISLAAGFRHSCISISLSFNFCIYLYIYLRLDKAISFTILLIICVQLTNAEKNFACGGLSSLMYFNFIKFEFLYLSLYIFKAIYCVYYSINYFCVTVANAVKKFRMRRAFIASVFQLH